ncbi:MAG: carbonic anhydrase [bacterium]
MDYIQKLKKGFQEFKDCYYGGDSKKSAEYAKLITEGQQPKTLMIACSDSRVSPEITFNAKPGDIFMVRNIANLVPPYDNDGHKHGTSAAIEFAVNYLGVKNIIVKGHSNCGGISALMKDENTGDFISPWVSVSRRAKEEVLKNPEYLTEEDRRTACEKVSIIVSLENLLTFPFVKKKYAGGEIKILGWYFDMKKGSLLEYNDRNGKFE